MGSFELPVYLDHHATTPVDPRVVDAMLPYFTQHFGNPASRSHAFGWAAAAAVRSAREQVAALIGARGARELVFTSGATESNNLALRGAAQSHADQGRHLITTAIEHSAVAAPIASLRGHGFRVTVLPVSSAGIVDPADLRAALAPDTILVSVMLANNEIGTIQPLAEIGRETRSRGVLLHCDAAQALGRVPIDVDAMGIDLLSVSAHKAYGPKGCGALYVRGTKPRLRLSPLSLGGGQERGMRAGTLDVPSIVGFGRACEILREEGPQEVERLGQLRDRLWERLVERLEGVTLNGDRTSRLSHNLHCSFDGIDGARLVAALSELALSNGAACSSGRAEPSRVLAALGLPAAQIAGSVRMGLGRFNTADEIEFAADRIVQEVQRLRAARSAMSDGPPTQ